MNFVSNVDLMSIVGFLFVLAGAIKYKALLLQALSSAKRSTLVEELSISMSNHRETTNKLNETIKLCDQKIKKQLEVEQSAISSLNHTIELKLEEANKTLIFHKKWLAKNESKRLSSVIQNRFKASMRLAIDAAQSNWNLKN